MKLHRNSMGELCALQAAAAARRCVQSVGIGQTAAKAAAGVSARYLGESARSFHLMSCIVPSVLCLRVGKDAAYLLRTLDSIRIQGK